MRYLLDTHILIWFLMGDTQLSKIAREEISSSKNKIFFSTLSIFEVEWKSVYRPAGISLNGKQLFELCKEAEFLQVPLKVPHILEIKNLKRKENFPPHKDPFDQLMLCQAIVEDMIFMTHDKRIAEYESKNIYQT